MKAGVHLYAVFPPLIMRFIEISRLRFKQSRNCMSITQFYALRCFENFGVTLGYI